LPPIPDVAGSWFAVEPILRKGDTPLQWLFRADRPLRVVFAGQMGPPLIEDLVGLSAAAVCPRSGSIRASALLPLSPVGADALGPARTGQSRHPNAYLPTAGLLELAAIADRFGATWAIRRT
jgi:hypothetical protein